MSLHSTSMQRWTWIPREPFRRTRMLRVTARRSLQHNMKSSGKLVTSSKGTYKINPAKTKRAARASLLDLGDTEVPDRVSWLDQPSLQDTMASTARIAQGLNSLRPQGSAMVVAWEVTPWLLPEQWARLQAWFPWHSWSYWSNSVHTKPTGLHTVRVTNAGLKQNFFFFFF